MPQSCLHFELKYQAGLRKNITLGSGGAISPSWVSFKPVLLLLLPTSSGQPLLALATHLFWMQMVCASCKL